MPTYPGGYYESSFNVPGKKQPASSSSSQARQYDPTNPHHVLLRDKGLITTLSVHAINEIARQRQQYIEWRDKRSPANPSSPAYAQIMGKIMKDIQSKGKDVDYAAIQAVLKRGEARMKQIIEAYNGQTQTELAGFDEKVKAWREKNAKVIDFLRGLPENAVFFVGTPDHNQVHSGLPATVQRLMKQLKESNVLSGKSWKWTEQGKAKLASLGYEIVPRFTTTDLGGGLKRSPLEIPIVKGLREKNPTLSSAQLVQKQLEVNLQMAKENVKHFQKELVELEDGIRKGIEYITGYKVNEFDKQSVEKLRKANRRYAELIKNYNIARASIETAVDNLVTAEREFDELGFLLEKKVTDIEEKTKALKGLMSDTSGKFRKWSKDLSIADVVPFMSEDYAGLPCRDIPIDYLLHVHKGIHIKKDEVHRFTKEGKNYEIPLPMFKADFQRWGPYPRQIVKEYLNSAHGQKRLRDYYGTDLPDYIRVIDRLQGDVLLEHDAKIREGLEQKLGPGDRERLYRDAAESLRATEDGKQYQLYYKRGLDQRLSPEQAKDYAQKILDETDPEKAYWRTPEAFQGRMQSKAEIKEFKREDYLRKRDYIRRLLTKLTADEFIRFWWPPENKPEGYRSGEEQRHRIEYNKLRAKMLQTDPLDYHTATSGPDEKAEVAGTKAGWRPNMPHWRTEFLTEASKILEEALLTNNREDILALRARLIELYHPTKQQSLQENNPEGLGTAEIEERVHDLNKLPYWEQFENDPDSDYVRYVHNELMARYNLFAHPDVIAEPVNITSEEATGSDVPYPELVTPEDDASREEFNRKQEDETTEFPKEYKSVNTLRRPPELTPDQRPSVEQTQFYTEISPFDADEMATGSDIEEYRKGKMFF